MALKFQSKEIIIDPLIALYANTFSDLGQAGWYF